mmetsp:Transcript_28882/g.44125  ORF Transcript_28882/g.44125 Transcript_28882/m.44125 type:complete len:734 (-) Transcript_28882:114-2315(-)|eukprot:CAMPEP_0194200384 /NCGR_PEP_ID=MMETSP0156-20130528/1009_1 /TAXON_ID=33649 /ORGANISM="Thalassionema nitzschioides, Strain L26-B" /LENGTH=733 /DNA_ID=CAMNT_0038925369 /DNA_START=38 /DNA_END=2239 /DNA_ORIENTATION=+
MKFLKSAVYMAIFHRAFGVESSLRRQAQGQRTEDVEFDCLAAVADIQCGNGVDCAHHALACERSNGEVIDITGVTSEWIESEIKLGNLHPGRSKIDVAGGKMTTNPSGKKEINLPGVVFENNGNNDRRRLAQIGDRTILAVRVVATDAVTGPLCAGENGISDSVFGTVNDPVNLKSQYSACSYNQLNWSAAATGVDGCVTVDLSTGANVCSVTEGDSAMRNKISAQLLADHGTAANSLANNLMYCLPPGTMSGIAYAFINSWMSVYSDYWCTYVSGQMHEVGHNIGLAHANEGGNTYQDQSGMMGYSYGQTDGPVMCFNAAKSWQLGWYTSKQSVADVNTAYVGLLGGVADYGNSAVNTIIVKINTSTAIDYYVTYNKKAGINSGTVEGANQVMVTSQGGEGASYAESSLLAKLNAGGTHTISNFDGTGQNMEITFIELINNVASVKIMAGCTSNADCDDGLLCNGLETCSGGACVSGSPLNCDDGIFCNGVETCSEAQGCVSGSNPCPNDSNACNGVESCDEVNDICVVTPAVDCSFESYGCGATKVCDPGTGACINNPSNPLGNDGTCDVGEFAANDLCTADCCGEMASATPNNGICEEGESCENSPNDCAGQLGGKPRNRYCCFGGVTAPAGTSYATICTNSACGDGSTCSEATGTTQYCCGDGVCTAGAETYLSCPEDCTTAPVAPPPTAAPVAAPTGGGCATCGNGDTCCFPSVCSESGKPANRQCLA